MKLDELKNSLDKSTAILVTEEKARFYLTGIKSSAGYLVITADKAVLFVDFRYIEMASKTVECEVRILDRGIYQVGNYMLEQEVKKLVIHTTQTSISEYKKYQKEFGFLEVVTDTMFDEFLSAARVIKTEDEIEKIAAAQKIGDAAFDFILTQIKVGMTENKIKALLEYFVADNGGDGMSFDTIALAGKNSSMPHGVPSENTVKNGDFVLMDFGVYKDGYCSDMTRTVCVGSPSDKMINVYETVLKAQTESLKALKTGVLGKDIDKIARDIINEQYRGSFGHGLGHGVGIEIHEEPSLSAVGNTPLAENMIVTVEPGIYLPDEFGVRIEDFVVIKENGIINLTSSPKQLICL